MPVAQPDRRRRVQTTCAEQRSQGAAQQDVAAADSAVATAVADFITIKEPNPPAAVLQQSTSPPLARHEDVHSSLSDVHAGARHLTVSPQQHRVPGPLAVHSTASTAAPRPSADAGPGPHDGGVAAAVSTSSKLLATPSHAVIGSGGDRRVCVAVGPSPSVHSSGSAALQQLGDITTATAAAAQDADDGMAPKTLQQARAEMLQRQEAAKAKHVSASQLLVWCLIAGGCLRHSRAAHVFEITDEDARRSGSIRRCQQGHGMRPKQTMEAGPTATTAANTVSSSELSARRTAQAASPYPLRRQKSSGWSGSDSGSSGWRRRRRGSRRGARHSEQRRPPRRRPGRS